MTLSTLNTEWERIEALAAIVYEARRGAEIGEARLARLRDLQGRVETARSDGAWRTIAPKGLDGLEYDVLACAVAPEISPRLAYTYQSLQGQPNQPYPTLHLVQELLSLEPFDAPLYDALDPRGRLRRERLIRIEGNGPFSTVQPAAGVAERLIERPLIGGAPPGAMAVTVEAGWDDIVLPANRIAMLKEFLAYMTCADRVFGAWGGQVCGGPIALFSGASGTGKTFAASVIAGALGWPLYRVDLGRLVSKYIGETEKNLNALFDAAHEAPMVLQFDEADSLFAKRGEVKEARDRYANLEVSHLLARIESHRGPCILTSNLREQIDQGFARRFQVVVDFPKPDATARARLWRLLLPPHAPIDQKVDLDLVADAAPLTGGHIRNAALHAAFLAAAGDGPIALRHIACAIWRELGKEGRPVATSEIGPLARFLDGGER